MARFIFFYLMIAMIGGSSAHFLLNYPTTIGFDDDLEGDSPCGSFSIDLTKDTVTDFHVGGDALALTSIHPEATWLFRATLDTSATPGNWSSLLPAISQTGLGNYCEQGVMVPSSWAGSKGVIGIVQDAPDGILYQCALVNFVAGTTTPPSVCTNATGIAAKFTTDAALSALPTSASSTSTPTSAAGGATSPASTAKPSLATTNYSLGGLSSFILVVLGVSATFVVRLV